MVRGYGKVARLPARIFRSRKKRGFGSENNFPGTMAFEGVCRRSQDAFRRNSA